MKSHLMKWGAIALSAAAIAACGGDDDDPISTPMPSVTPTMTPTPAPAPPMSSVGLSTSVLDESHRFDSPAMKVVVTRTAADMFEITMINLTNGQPLSPVLSVLHDGSYEAFVEGESASVGLEEMAEGGMTGTLASEADAMEGVLLTAEGSAPIPPKGTQMRTLAIASSGDSEYYLSLLTMLVNTNDGFTGLMSERISDLEMGESHRFYAPAWDAGTEANTEAQGTMPGPADGGEGFSAVRDDRIDRVRLHGGVVTNALADDTVVP